MDSFIIDQCNEFEGLLAAKIHSVYEETGENNLRRLRKENEALELTQIKLVEELRLLTAVNAFVKSMDCSQTTNRRKRGNTLPICSWIMGLAI